MTSKPYRPWRPVSVIPSGEDRKPATDIEISESDARAIRAVAEGIASPDQQKAAVVAFMWICGAHDLEYLPDEHGGERDSAFKSGKRHVGLQLRKLVSFPFHLLTGEPNDRADSGRGGRAGRGSSTRAR